MNKIQNTAALIAALALLSFTGGCVTKGNDPVVVQAERVTELAVDVFDSFLRWEDTNRELLRSTPEIKQTADFIRGNAQGWLFSARAMTKAYKENRTPENKANLETALKVLEQAMAEATAHWKPAKEEPLQSGVPMSPALLLAALTLLIELNKSLPKWIKDAKGRGEFTPEEEAAFDKRIAELTDQEHWKIEP